ncbi:chromogranin-A isoform X2 [Erinaceus europaeus]|uniref:Chromogranin-A n=1 Tax=Erinaceus europaeus TaxID=9365 RepID=A0ABM3WK11_ERIEU|nr:chromogranin-A isoform X2 [Erinaceus europaeus]
MHPAAVLALLLCAGQAFALPVGSPADRGDPEVMKCVIEVISDTLSKPTPMPVSQHCFETLRGDERILSVLRHQNLLKELQDLALQGAKERTQQKHSGLEEALGAQGNRALWKGPAEGPKEAEKRGGDGDHGRGAGGPQVPAEPAPRSSTEEDKQAPREEEATTTHPPPSLPGQKRPGLPAKGGAKAPSPDLADGEKGVRAEGGQQKEHQEEEAGEKAGSEDEGPPATADPHPTSGHKDGWPGDQARDGAGKMGAEKLPSGKEWERPRQQEPGAGAPQGLFQGGRKLGQLAKEWADTRRWSRLGQLAEERTAGAYEEPDRSMKLPFQAPAYDLRGLGPLPPRGWGPSSQEDHGEASLPLQLRGYPEEKKEEEGSANRRPEDQELESLSAIEAELEKVARQLQALRQG